MKAEIPHKLAIRYLLSVYSEQLRDILHPRTMRYYIDTYVGSEKDSSTSRELRLESKLKTSDGSIRPSEKPSYQSGSPDELYDRKMLEELLRVSG